VRGRIGALTRLPGRTQQDGILAVGGEADREVEGDAGAARSVVLDAAREAVVAAEERARTGQVALGDPAPYFRAAHLFAIREVGRNARDGEALAFTERRERLRRAAALVAEGGVRRHDEAGDLDQLSNRRDEGVVRRYQKGMVEMLDDGDLDSCGLEADEPLVRIAQQRRRQTLD